MPSLFHPGRFVIPLLALLLMVSADAAVIYRWIDKQGRTHFSDVVPEEYKGVAELVKPVTTPPAPEQQQRAIERAAQQKARAAALPSIASQPGPNPAPAAASPARSKRPSRAPTDDTDCATWRSLYSESLECFGPYRTVHGTKAEAFEHCTPVLEPPIRCQRNAP